MENRSPTAPSRGERTREALIAAGLEIFGRDGFDAAGTRAISQAAGANQALIAYHFGGKPGLYRAVLQDIADRVRHRFGPLVAEVERELDALDAGAADPAESRSRHLGLLHDLTDAFVAMLTAPEFGARARLILREQLDPSDAFEVLYEGFMGRMLGAVTRLIAALRNQDPGGVETRLLAATVLGQALVFRAARAAVTRHLDWQRIGPAETAAIQETVRRNVSALVGEESVG